MTATLGIGHNGAPFDFFELFDLIVNSSASTTEKLVALLHARHIGKNGSPAYPSRTRVAQQASVSSNTLQRSLPIVRSFFNVEQRRGRASLYHPKATLTADQIEAEIIKARGKKPAPKTITQNRVTPKTIPQNSIPQNGVYPKTIPQNDRGVCPKMGVQNDSLKNTTLDKAQAQARGQDEKIDLDRLETRLLDACNGAAANPAVAPNILVLSEPLKWIKAGCDLELDILPTIRARAHRMRPGSVKNWSYFTQAVADAKASREAPMPVGEAGQSSSSMPEWQRRKQDALAYLFRKE